MALICASQGIFFIFSNHLFITYASDIIVISEYLRYFNESVLAGHIYPHWLNKLSGGTGLPVFVFYPPLAFYIGSLLHLPGNLDPYGIYQLGLAMALGLFVCAAGNYIWLKRHTSTLIAGAIVCILLIQPARFTLMHIYAPLAQIWATALFPFALYYLERWREGKNQHIFYFCAILSAIILTHLPSFLMFGPILLCYGVFYTGFSWRHLLWMVGIYILSFELTAFYWLPGILNESLIKTQMYYKLFSVQDTDRFFSGLSQLAAIPVLFFALMALIYPKKSSCIKLPIYPVTGMALFAGFLFLPMSKCLWDSFLPLHILQWPLRLLSLLFAVFPIFLLQVSKWMRLSFIIFLNLLILLPSGWANWYEYQNIYRSFSYPVQIQEKIYRDISLGITGYEFTPLWVPVEKMTSDFLEKNYASIPRASVVTGKAKITIMMWNDGYIAMHISTVKPGTLQIKQNFFPAWHAISDNGALTIHPSSLGLILIDVPAGEHDITLTFTNLQGAQAGILISLASLLVWGVLYLYYFPSSSRNKKHES